MTEESERMSDLKLPRILVVDDEEAILETMTFTFMDVYEVLTASDGDQALEILDANAPVSVVITDQRMPKMTGVELLAKVFERHPETVRIMLTGFADADATIKAINDGHIYAYINKPWEPTELKQVVRRAVAHHDLALENARLVTDLRNTNLFLHAVMDRLNLGALAVDASGAIQAVNRPAGAYLKLSEDVSGQDLGEVLERQGLANLSAVTMGLAECEGGSFEDMDLRVDGSGHRLRVSSQSLQGPDGRQIGRVILFKEISHEPLRRRFEEVVSAVAHAETDTRAAIEEGLRALSKLARDFSDTKVTSPDMIELDERVARSQTALQNWLDVDESLAQEDYPDAQLLQDRMRIANQRWPYPDDLPEGVRVLAKNVEAYYESGENPRQRAL
jgi:FixJ family two-component response regulator